MQETKSHSYSFLSRGAMAVQYTEKGIPKQDDQIAECHGDVLPDLDYSMWYMFRSTATTYPQRQAIISLWQQKSHLSNLKSRNQDIDSTSDNSEDSSTCFQWSYEDLIIAVERLAGFLQSQGCNAGENLVSVLTWTCTIVSVHLVLFETIVTNVISFR
jgi:hypothetical protein